MIIKDMNKIDIKIAKFKNKNTEKNKIKFLSIPNLQ